MTLPEGLQTRGEDRAESPPLSGTVDDNAASAIGPNDYPGALSGSGESDREDILSESEGKGVGTSVKPSRPSSPADKVEMKLSVAPRKYALLLIYVTDDSITQADLRFQAL
jgi:hypothetical protein